MLDAQLFRAQRPFLYFCWNAMKMMNSVNSEHFQMTITLNNFQTYMLLMWIFIHRFLSYRHIYMYIYIYSREYFSHQKTKREERGIVSVCELITVRMRQLNIAFIKYTLFFYLQLICVTSFDLLIEDKIRWFLLKDVKFYAISSLYSVYFIPYPDLNTIGYRYWGTLLLSVTDPLYHSKLLISYCHLPLSFLQLSVLLYLSQSILLVIHIT